MRSLLSISHAKTALACTLLAIFSFSCSKDNQNNKSDCLLTSLRCVFVEEDQNGIDHDTIWYKFVYNADGEIIQYKIDDDVRYELLYDEDGKIWKIEDYYYDELQGYELITRDVNVETHQYWWNNDGSFEPRDLKSVYGYSNNNQIDVINTYRLLDEEWNLSGYRTFIYENNNMIRMDAYEGDASISWYTTQTYDDKRNPLRNIQAYWFIGPSPYFYFSSNNPVNVTNGENDTVIYNWTYNSNDYPAQMTFDSHVSGDNDHAEFLFEYICE
jgi:hypothetical protein